MLNKKRFHKFFTRIENTCEFEITESKPVYE